MKTVPPSSWVCLGVFVLALADHFAGVPLIGDIAAALLVLFVVLEAHAAPRLQASAAVLFTGVGLGAAAWGGDLRGGLSAGLDRTLLFFLMFAAVAWLQVPADSSPTLRAAQGVAMRQPPGRRFLVLAAVSHILGSVLNLAGVSLMARLVRDQTDPAAQARLTRAMTHAFTSAPCWSPFYVAITVILSVLPGQRWSDLAPLGLLSAAVLIGVSWTMDRTLYRRASATVQPAATADTGGVGWRMAVILISLFTLVIGMVEGGGLPIPIALGLVAPAYAVVWAIAQAGGRAPGAAAAALAHRVVGALPGLRSEILLFLGANLFGSGLAVALPTSAVERVVAGLALPVDIVLFAIMAGIVSIAAAGLHPVVPIVLVATVLPPEVLGVAPELFGAMMLAMWGLGVVVSPFSGISLYIRRVAGVSPWTVGWVWNGPYAAAGTVAIWVLIVVTRHLGIY